MVAPPRGADPTVADVVLHDPDEVHRVRGAQPEDGVGQRAPRLVGDGAGERGPVLDVTAFQQVIDRGGPELGWRRALRVVQVSMPHGGAAG